MDSKLINHRPVSSGVHALILAAAKLPRVYLKAMQNLPSYLLGSAEQHVSFQQVSKTRVVQSRRLTMTKGSRDEYAALV